MRHPFLLLLPLALSGCNDLLFSAEEKINAAVPFTRELTLLKSDVIAQTPEGKRAALEAEFATRMKLRAVTCAKGYEPTRLTPISSVAEHFKDVSCFTEFDKESARWFSRRLIGMMLAAPPLRPIPAEAPKFIVGDSHIDTAKFAHLAPIALLRTRQGLQVIDMAAEKTLFAEAGFSGQLGELSPNGRLFFTFQGTTTTVRNSETGAVILEMPRAHNFNWAGSGAAVFSKLEPSKTVLLDFVSDTEVTLPDMNYGSPRVTDLGRDEYYALGYKSLLKFRVERDSSGARAKLLEERKLNGDRGGAVTIRLDRRLTWFDSERHLNFLDLDGGEIKRIPFAPLMISSAIATADPDQIVISHYGGYTQEPHVPQVFSMKDQTLARVDASALVSTRLVYIPSLKRNGVMSDTKITVLDKIPTLERVALANVQEEAGEKLNMMKLESFSASQEMSVRRADVGSIAANYALNNLVRGIQSTAGAPNKLLQELAKDARVEAIGVYRGPRDGTSADQIDVRIKPSKEPLVLVLSSYEKIVWNLKPDPGVRLKAVLVSGYTPSRVVGQGDAAVVNLGRSYAYKLDTTEYHALNASVKQATGKTIYYFQGKYESSGFTAGGL